VVFRSIPPQGGRVTDIAAVAGVSKQAMAYTIDALVAMGYLTREPDPGDRRAQIVRRTERGWEVNRAARRAVQEVQAEWTEALGPERMEQLLGLLRELVGHLDVAYQGSISEVSTRERPV
jgi:DNA-binding MarR family transcriptional regulator